MENITSFGQRHIALPEEALRQRQGSMLAAWKNWPTTTLDEQPHHVYGSWSADIFGLIVLCLQSDDPVQVSLDEFTSAQDIKEHFCYFLDSDSGWASQVGRTLAKFKHKGPSSMRDRASASGGSANSAQESKSEPGRAERTERRCQGSSHSVTLEWAARGSACGEVEGRSGC